MSARSLTGVVVAVLGVVAVGVGLIAFATRADGTSVFDLDVGDCFVLPSPAEIGDDATFDLDRVEVLICDDPHDAEVVAVGRLNPDRDRGYPSDDLLFAEVDRRCAESAVFDPSRFGLVPIAPNEASWEPLQGGFVCLAVPYGGEPVTGSAVPTARSS